MHLTLTQVTAFKADLAANANLIPAGQPWSGSFAGQAINTLPNSSDANAAIAGWYNLPRSSNWTVWRRTVPLAEIGKKLNGAELGGLSSLNHTRLQTVIILTNATGGADPSLADQRAFWDDIFSGAGGAVTRPALLILWKRLASNLQKLFSTGTGSDAVPATTNENVGDNFSISGPEVESIRNQA